MTHPKLRWIANGFVVAYALDAGFSGLEELLRGATGSMLLLAPRNALAQLVVWAALSMALAMAVTPRLPTGLFLLLSVSALWLNFGAAPLALFVEPTAVGPVGTAIQLGVAAVGFGWIRLRNGGRGWLLRSESLTGPGFSLRHSLAFVAGVVVVGLPAVTLYVGVLAATWLQLATRGFVAFNATGVSLGDRRYVRADREVRLVGMMHVGEEEGYRELVRSFVGERTVVLEEGVTDERARLNTPLTYGRVAAALGIGRQEELDSYLDLDEEELADEPVFLHADVDLAELSPETIEWLEQVAKVYAAEQPLAALRAFGEWAGEHSNQWQIVQHDVFARRNQQLLAQIDESLTDYDRIVVPWGALHLPAIEAAIVNAGFVRTSEARHPLITWRGIAEHLFGAR